MPGIAASDKRMAQSLGLVPSQRSFSYLRFHLVEIKTEFPRTIPVLAVDRFMKPLLSGALEATRCIRLVFNEKGSQQHLIACHEQGPRSWQVLGLESPVQMRGCRTRSQL